MPYIFLGIALLALLLLFGQLFVRADLKMLARVLRWLAVVFAIGFVVFLAVSKRWSLLPALLIPALPWLMRLGALSSKARNVGGPSAGQASSVETPFLRMVLDHDSGTMDGDVLQGRFSGRKVSQLSNEELLALWRECGGDEQSRLVLESYLDRAVGSDWRDQAQSQQGGDGAQAGMSQQEAREILGVGENASPEDIDAAYRRLMLKMHPDHGGSDWLAAKINRAREVLLGHT